MRVCVCVSVWVHMCVVGPAILASSLGVGVSETLPNIQSPLPPEPLWGLIMNV